MKKKIFEAPELDIILFEANNIIATSGEGYTVEEKIEKDLDEFEIKF